MQEIQNENAQSVETSAVDTESCPSHEPIVLSSDEKLQLLADLENSLAPDQLGIIQTLFGQDFFTKASAAIIQEGSPDTEAEDVTTQWQRATYLLVGTLLQQFGRRACEFKQKELLKFQTGYELKMIPKPDGAIRYEIVKIKQVKHDSTTATLN